MKRRSQAEWQALIEAQAESGLSASQFCKEHDISEKYFSTVKYKLKKKSPVSSPFQPVSTPSLETSIAIHYKQTQIKLPQSIAPQWLAMLAKELAQ